MRIFLIISMLLLSVALEAKVCVKNPTSIMAAPDYARMESTNRITSSGGSWTVEKDGYAAISTSGSHVKVYEIYINEQLIESMSNNGSNTYVSGVGGVYPVSKGDTIRVIGQNVRCHFIPPRQ